MRIELTELLRIANAELRQMLALVRHRAAEPAVQPPRELKAIEQTTPNSEIIPNRTCRGHVFVGRGLPQREEAR
jgi:hypothetical protein